MPTLHVRNVPDDLYARLRQRAAVQNRSLSAEVISLLDTALEGSGAAQADVLERIRRRRFFEPAAAGAPESTSLLRADRER
jgi:plasmid stability protein